MAKAPINVTISGDYNDRDIKRAMKDLQSLMKDGGKTESSFASLGKSAIGLGAAIGVGFAGFQSLTSFLSDSIAEAQEAIKVNAATAQIIKQTGNAANVTADQVADLSQRLSEQIAVDDELIQQSANLILTFKNIANQGEGLNAIFDRTVLAAQDLAAAGFGDAESAAKMLGKALNDPERGLTALGRAGVTFTAQQKEQIKTLVEGGNVLEAQKVILGEVESQVGGVAGATATGIDKFNVYFGNLKEELGLAILPFINAMISGVLPAIKNTGIAIQSASKFIQENSKAVIIATAGIIALTAAMLANRIGGIAFAAQYAAHTVVMAAYTAGARIATIATTTLTTAMRALPFALVVTGLILLASKLTDGAEEAAKLRDEVYKTARAQKDLADETGKATTATINAAKQGRFYTGAQKEAKAALSGTVSAALAYGNTLPGVTDKTLDLADASMEASRSIYAVLEAAVNAARIQRDLANTAGTVTSAIRAGLEVGPMWDQLLAKLQNGYVRLEEGAKRATGGAKSANDELDKLSTKKQARLDALKELAETARESMKEMRDSIYATVSGWLNIGTAAEAYAARQKAVSDTLAALEEGRSRITKEATAEQLADLQKLADEHERAKAAAAAGAQSIVGEFMEQEKKFGEFGKKMRELLAAGLNRTTFMQIMELGADRGSEVADAYLKGNTQELINQTNDTVREYDKLSQEIAQESAKAFYQAGLTSAIALLKGFSLSLAKGSAARKEMIALIKDLEKDLTINVTTNVATPTGGTQSFTPSPSTPQFYDTTGQTDAQVPVGAIPTGRGHGSWFNPISGQIEYFAKGGIVTAPMMGIVGEAGPEAIIPLDRLGDMGGSTTNINLTVNAGMGTDGAEVGRQIVDALKAYERRNGAVYASA